MLVEGQQLAGGEGVQLGEEDREGRAVAWGGGGGSGEGGGEGFRSGFGPGLGLEVECDKTGGGQV